LIQNYYEIITNIVLWEIKRKKHEKWQKCSKKAAGISSLCLKKVFGNMAYLSHKKSIKK
jgi:hypothetical protein